MAHIWVENAEGWNAVRLDGSGALPVGCAHPGSSSDLASAPAVRIVRVDSSAMPAWLLIAPLESNALVNGRPPAGGLRVLRDRDEIRTLSGARCFFSSESLAEVVPFAAAGRAVYCGRCRQSIDTGALSVRCPNCGIAFHQSEDLPCWTYGEHCPFCGAVTALDAGFSWIPEE